MQLFVSLHVYCNLPPTLICLHSGVAVFARDPLANPNINIMNAAAVIQMHHCKILFCDITSLFEDIKVDEKKTVVPKQAAKETKRGGKKSPRS